MKKIFFLTVCLMANIALAQSSDEVRQTAHLDAVMLAKTCNKIAWSGKEISTIDMLESSDRENDCLTEFIEREADKAFNPQDNFRQIIRNRQDAVAEYYATYHQSGKYCEDGCGSMSGLFIRQRLKEENIKMLEELIFLNRNQSPS